MKRTVYKNRYLSIERETFRVRGKELEFFSLVQPTTVVIVPRLRDGRLIVERQYRPVLKKCLYEFPAGFVNKTETPRAAAVRELEEETGYLVRKARPMSDVYWTPGSSMQTFFFFLADVEGRVKKSLDDMEQIRMVRMTSATLEKAIRSGRIRDGKTVLGFMLYKKYFAGK